MSLVLSEDASAVVVYRNVTPRTVPVGAQPQLDCRTCLFMSERSCSCADECVAGSRHAQTEPLRLWRSA